MTEKLQNSIAHLRVLSPKLNEATDNAAKVVQRVEKFLNDECRIGIPSQVVVSQNAELEPFLLLGYERYGEKFRVTVTQIEYVMKEGQIARGQFEEPLVKSSEKMAWTECPRGMKLDSFTKLPELLEKIAADTEKAIESAAAASTAVETILAALDLPAASASTVAPAQPPQPTKAGSAVSAAQRTAQIMKDRMQTAVEKAKQISAL